MVSKIERNLMSKKFEKAMSEVEDSLMNLWQDAP